MRPCVGRRRGQWPVTPVPTHGRRRVRRHRFPFISVAVVSLGRRRRRRRRRHRRRRNGFPQSATSRLGFRRRVPASTGREAAPKDEAPSYWSGVRLMAHFRRPVRRQLGSDTCIIESSITSLNETLLAAQ